MSGSHEYLRPRPEQDYQKEDTDSLFERMNTVALQTLKNALLAKIKRTHRKAEEEKKERPVSEERSTDSSQTRQRRNVLSKLSRQSNENTDSEGQQ